MTEFYDWVPSISEILSITAVTRPFSELLQQHLRRHHYTLPLDEF